MGGCLVTGCMYVPYWLFQFVALLIHGIFFEGVGDHNFEKKLPFVVITHILYIVDSHARRGLSLLAKIKLLGLQIVKIKDCKNKGL